MFFGDIFLSLCEVQICERPSQLSKVQTHAVMRAGLPCAHGKTRFGPRLSSEVWRVAQGSDDRMRHPPCTLFFDGLRGLPCEAHTRAVRCIALLPPPSRCPYRPYGVGGRKRPRAAGGPAPFPPWGVSSGVIVVLSIYPRKRQT
jgi:hypothetical protein